MGEGPREGMCPPLKECSFPPGRCAHTGVLHANATTTNPIAVLILSAFLAIKSRPIDSTDSEGALGVPMSHARFRRQFGLSEPITSAQCRDSAPHVPHGLSAHPRMRCRRVRQRKNSDAAFTATNGQVRKRVDQRIERLRA